MTRLVFMDTETTGLSLDDDIWEFAAIIREPGKDDVEIQAFVSHDTAKAAQLPPSFLADYTARYDDDLAMSPFPLTTLVYDLTKDRAHIVGAVPNFDTERLSRLMTLHGFTPGWHYHLIDVENLAVGYLAAGGQDVPLPWDSDALSAALGVTAPADARHTALGDARWARDLYDAVMRNLP